MPNEIFPVIAKQDGLGPGFVVRKKILADIGYYDERMGPSADNELFMRLGAKHPMFFSTTPHTTWRLHSDNLTHKWKLIDQTKDGLKILKKIFFDYNLPLELIKYSNETYISFYSKVLNNVRFLLNQGDWKTAQKILSILSKEDIIPSEIEYK